MGAKVKVNASGGGSFDFSPYLRLQDDESPAFDPTGGEEWLEPEFSGSPAFGEGLKWVADAAGNKTLIAPLLLKAETRAKLAQMIASINAVIDGNGEVEIASGVSDNPTFFDLERGKLDVQYQYLLTSVHAMARATLRLFTRPYGTTGAMRGVATAVGTGPQVLVATGIIGDVAAQGQLRVSLPSGALGQSEYQSYIAYGVKYPVPSGWNPISLSNVLVPGASAVPSIFGASGRLASQILKFAVAATNSAKPKLWELPLREADAGRYRVLVSMNHGFNSVPGSNASMPYVSISDEGMMDDGNAEGRVYLNEIGGGVPSVWTLLDFGEFNYTTGSPNLVWTWSGGPSLGIGGGTYRLSVEGVFLVPVDISAGIYVRYQEESFQALIRLASSMWKYEFDADAKQVRKSAVGVPAALDVTLGLRGQLPMLPAVGSPMASGPANVFIMYTGADFSSIGQGWKNTITYDLAVKERFNFLRP
jgi:hypothetical protein